MRSRALGRRIVSQYAPLKASSPILLIVLGNVTDLSPTPEKSLAGILVTALSKNSFPSPSSYVCFINSAPKSFCDCSDSSTEEILFPLLVLYQISLSGIVLVGSSVPLPGSSEPFVGSSLPTQDKNIAAIKPNKKAWTIFLFIIQKTNNYKQLLYTSSWP